MIQQKFKAKLKMSTNLEFQTDRQKIPSVAQTATTQSKASLNIGGRNGNFKSTKKTRAAVT